MRGERIFNTALLGLFGVAFGLGLFTFFYARGFSYLSDDPVACVNCHIMRDQFEGWSHSSHREVATCNDCHTPHRFPDKWVIKGVNGWNHSVAFTTDNFPEPIRIRGFNARIAQENCVDCHATTVAQMHLFVSPEELNCVDCHGNVGHNNAPTMPNERRIIQLPLSLESLAPEPVPLVPLPTDAPTDGAETPETEADE